MNKGITPPAANEYTETVDTQAQLLRHAAGLIGLACRGEENNSYRRGRLALAMDVVYRLMEEYEQEAEDVKVPPAPWDPSEEM